MTQPPEMEIIDQLCGGDMRLDVLAKLFSDTGHARLVLTGYLDGHAIILRRNGQPVPEREARGLLRESPDLAAETSVDVSLTEAAAKAFTTGGWESFFSGFRTRS
jgi:hypothetical protein